MIEMFGFWRSAASFRVRMALNVKTLIFNETMIDLDAGEQNADNFIEINPQAKVPTVLFENGVKLTQSLAILEYLEEMYPMPALLPGDPFGRGRVRALAGLWAADHHPLIVPRIRTYLRDVLGASEAQRTAWIRHWFSEGLRVGEATLAEDPATGTFCHGDVLTLADLCLMSQVMGARGFQINFEPYPTINRITQSCLALDAVSRALPGLQPGATCGH
jgi:maleylacetoacetate isomerase